MIGGGDQPGRRPSARERFPNYRTPLGRWFYDACRKLCRLVVRVLYRARALHLERVPQSGAVLLVSNHQSHFDPPLVGGFITWRSTCYLARDSLFKNPLFGRLIGALGSIPVSRGQADTAAIRAAIERLREGTALLLFPEGTRSATGELGTFKRGAALLLRRAKCPVIPVGVSGPLDAFPRHRVFPRLFGVRIAVAYGEPIDHAELMALGDDGALARLRDEIDALRLEAEGARRRSPVASGASAARTP